MRLGAVLKSGQHSQCPQLGVYKGENLHKVSAVGVQPWICRGKFAACNELQPGLCQAYPEGSFNQRLYTVAAEARSAVC